MNKWKKKERPPCVVVMTCTSVNPISHPWRFQVVNDLVFSGSSDTSVHAHNIHVRVPDEQSVNKLSSRCFFDLCLVFSFAICAVVIALVFVACRLASCFASTRVTVMPSHQSSSWGRWWWRPVWINWSECTSYRYLYRFWSESFRNNSFFQFSVIMLIVLRFTFKFSMR